MLAFNNTCVDHEQCSTPLCVPNTYITYPVWRLLQLFKRSKIVLQAGRPDLLRRMQGLMPEP